MVNTKFNSAINCANQIKFDLSISKAVKLYQENPTDELYAFIYKKVYKLAMKVKQDFKLLDWADAESISMLELHKCLNDFDFTKTSKFTTLYTTYVKRAYYREQKRLFYDVRKVNAVASSYDKLLAETHFDIIDENKDIEVFELIESLPESLNESEQQYCILRAKYVNITDTDIAEKLGVSPANITYIKSRLKKKLKSLI